MSVPLYNQKCTDSPVNIPNQSKLSQETFSKDLSPSLELCNSLFALLVTSDNFCKYISHIIEKIFVKLMPQTGYCARQWGRGSEHGRHPTISYRSDDCHTTVTSWPFVCIQDETVSLCINSQALLIIWHRAYSQTLTRDEWVNEVHSSGLSEAFYLEIVSMWNNSKSSWALKFYQ